MHSTIHALNVYLDPAYTGGELLHHKRIDVDPIVSDGSTDMLRAIVDALRAHYPVEERTVDYIHSTHKNHVLIYENQFSLAGIGTGWFYCPVKDGLELADNGAWDPEAPLFRFLVEFETQ